MNVAMCIDDRQQSAGVARDAATVLSSLTSGVPGYLLRSPLMRAGGCGVVDQWLHPSVHIALAGEATARQCVATSHDTAVSDGEEIRGGEPARRFLSAPGGPIQQWVYRDPRTADALQSATGLNLEPTGTVGTFAYYCRAGDHLALHRDIDSCDVALITCLADTGAGPHAGGGEQWLYPGRWQEPLSQIRRTSQRGGASVRLRPGQSLLLLGGLIPHLVSPVVTNQTRIVSLLCFRAV